MPDHQHSPNVTFHSLGIGSDNNNKKIKTLETIRKQLGYALVSILITFKKQKQHLFFR